MLDEGQSGSLVGRELGPYKILSLLGAGGMGESTVPKIPDLTVRSR